MRRARKYLRTRSPRKTVSRASWDHAKPEVKPVRGKTLDYEATAERIEREQSRQLQHDTMRSVDAREPREHRSIGDLPVGRAGFHRRGGGAEHQGERDAEERVQDDDGAIAVDGRP